MHSRIPAVGMDAGVSSGAPTMPPASSFQRSTFVARSTSCDRCDGLSRQLVSGTGGQSAAAWPASVVDVVMDVVGVELTEALVVEDVLGAAVEDVGVVVDDVVDEEVLLLVDVVDDVVLLLVDEEVELL